MASPSSIIESKCFICSASFDARKLPQHERECLANLQDNLTTITTEVDNLLETEVESVKSATSTGSSEGSSRKTVRCYICGNDFPTHFISLHERQCKRKWESGVTNNDALRKGSSLGNMSLPLEDGFNDAMRNTNKTNGMKKAQSVANVSHREPKQAWNARMRETDANEVKSSQKKKIERSSSAKKKPRPKSAYSYSSRSTQDLSSPYFERNAISIFNDTGSAVDIANELNVVNNNGSDSCSPSAVDKPQKPGTPRFTECKYCCNKFSVHSISIHEKKCRMRDEKENKPKKKPIGNGRCVSVSELRFGKDDSDWLVERNLDQSFAESVDVLNLTGVADARPTNVFQRFFQCHLCGKQFGSKSLPIHVRQCEKAREKENAKSNEKVRLPRRKDFKRMYHSEVNLNADNQDKVHKNLVAPVSNGFEKHALGDKTPRRNKLRTDKVSDQKKEVQISSSEKKCNPSSSGNYVRCHFCKNYYGSASITIHEVKCGIKMERSREDETPKNFSRTPRKQCGSARRLFDLQR